MRDAAEAARLVGGIAAVAVGGEYRVTRDGVAPVYASAAAIRAWTTSTEALPEALNRSLWRRECERARALEELIGTLRTLLYAATRRGLLPHACVPVVIGMVERAAADPRSFGDLAHGPLSR